MKFKEKLKRIVEDRGNYLCVGLDPDVSKLPSQFKRDVQGIFDFTRKVIEITADLVPAYKFNLAFFEVWGARGWEVLENLRRMLPQETIAIADGKRGDIGNSARFYAKALLENLDFDAVTLSPYLGAESILPFIQDERKGGFVLCVTSNSSAVEIQDYGGEKPLYIKIAEMVSELNSGDNLGLVVGATKSGQLKLLRERFPELPFLIPGVGAQGGDAGEAVEACSKGATGLVNVSRGILFPGTDSIESIRERTLYYRNLLRVREV